MWNPDLGAITTTDVASDGACLYRALSLGVHGTEEKHKMTRTAVLDALELEAKCELASADVSAAFAPEGGLQAYLQRARRPREWADGYVIEHLMRKGFSGKTVGFFTQTNTRAKRVGASRAPPDVAIMNINNVHFVLINPANTSQRAQAKALANLDACNI